MGIFDKLKRLIFTARAAPMEQAQPSKAGIIAVEAKTRSLPDKKSANSRINDVPDKVLPESLVSPGKEIEVSEKSDPDRQNYSASVVRVILMSINSHFKVINESIEMAWKSNNPETKLSMLGAARNRLEEARKLASKFNLEIGGFDTAEAEISRIVEAIKTDPSTEIVAMQPTTQTVTTSFRLEDYRKNAGNYECLQWLATLDSATCLICAARDLKRYTIMDDPPEPIGHNLPWSQGPGVIHSGCRCVVIGVVKPIKGGPKLRPGTRASDEGQMPSTMSFEQFLRRKGRVFQEQVLGVARADQWRSKKLTLEELISDDGTPLTVEQLRAKYG